MQDDDDKREQIEREQGDAILRQILSIPEREHARRAAMHRQLEAGLEAKENERKEREHGEG